MESTAMQNTKHQRIVVLTGAGISAESGINTFRDSGGLWENHRLEDVATPEAFEHNPELVQRFYNARRAQLNDVKPNPAHIALAEFEAAFTCTAWLAPTN
ncbi:MAG: NAD-dependent deacetylase [Halioglobus sp.]|jgi:NAD-dependent deacetylase